MDNREFDRYVKEKCPADIVQHLRGIGLENLAFYIDELLELEESLSDFQIDNNTDLQSYLKESLTAEDFSSVVQDFFEECDIYTDDDTDTITRDDMEKCKQTTFTKYLPYGEK